MVGSQHVFPKGATLPKHIKSPVVWSSAREIFKEALRSSPMGEDPAGGKKSWLELVQPVVFELLEEFT